MSAFDFLPSYPLPPNPVLLFGLLLLAGFVGGELVQRLNLPRITGYVAAGLVLGASGFNLVDTHVATGAGMFVNLGLGIVLFETDATATACFAVRSFTIGVRRRRSAAS